MSTPKKTKTAAPATPVIPPTPEVKAPRERLPQQNGFTRPSPGSKTGVIWDIADRLTAEAGGTHAQRKDVLAAVFAEYPETSQGTATTQYGRWRRYHGLQGRSLAAEPVEEPTPAPTAAKAIAKAIAKAAAKAKPGVAPAPPAVPAKPAKKTK